MKKTQLVLIALLLLALPLAASAQTLPVCGVEDCHQAQEHLHDGTAYAGHTLDDGHDHQLCPVKGCTEAGSHEHGGTTHLPHNSGDGHAYHGSSGRHGGGKSGHRGGHH